MSSRVMSGQVMSSHAVKPNAGSDSKLAGFVRSSAPTGLMLDYRSLRRTAISAFTRFYLFALKYIE
jgi:hypothetical protein